MIKADFDGTDKPISHRIFANSGAYGWTFAQPQGQSFNLIESL
jgi:hypothetical protein